MSRSRRPGQPELRVWARQDASFFEQARIDLDGTLVPTGGECKQGMDIAYNGVWGYHPLIVSLANTGEVLSLVNRSGNRPSHEGAAEEVDRAIALCLEAGFRRLLLRGDTDFTQTKQLDRWNATEQTLHAVIAMNGDRFRRSKVQIGDVFINTHASAAHCRTGAERLRRSEQLAQMISSSSWRISPMIRKNQIGVEGRFRITIIAESTDAVDRNGRQSAFRSLKCLQPAGN